MGEMIPESFGMEYFERRSQDGRRKVAYELDAQKIKSRKADIASILDIGCGTGEFGDYFDACYYGYDPFYPTAHKILPKSRKFNLVVFRGTIQCMPNPVEMLVKARGYLNENGMLAVLATPDTDSLGYWRWGTLPALDAPRNWIPFGRRMLRNVLERLGFRQIEILHPYGKPYAKPLQNLKNFIIGKPDAFPGNMMDAFAWR